MPRHVVELRRRVHRLHLAGARVVLRPRRLRHRAARDPHGHQPVAGDAGRRRRGGGAGGPDRHRQPPGPWRVVRDRLDRAGADPAAGLPVVGLVHRRLQRPAGPPAVRHLGPAARAARAVLLPPRRAPGRRPARLVGDRPLPLRDGPQGDPRGRGQGPVPGRPDVQLQARRVRGLGVLHGPGRRPVRPVVRLPGPDLPVLDPGRRLHGADEPARRDPQPPGSPARRGDRRLRGGVLQEPVRRHPVPPGRDGPAARRRRAVHARRDHPGARPAREPVPAAGGLHPRGVAGRPRRAAPAVRGTARRPGRRPGDRRRRDAAAHRETEGARP